MSLVIGSMAQHRPVWLAERAIDAIAEHSKSAKAKFAVSIVACGKVVVERAHYANPLWIVATATRKSCPDWLEDELRHEWGSRNA